MDIRVNGITGFQPVTREALFGAWMSGKAITLSDPRNNAVHSGLIMGIQMESGYWFGEKPQHFLVTVYCPATGYTAENLYVKCPA